MKDVAYPDHFPIAEQLSVWFSLDKKWIIFMDTQQ